MVATSHDVMLDIELYQPTDEANALALAANLRTDGHSLVDCHATYVVFSDRNTSSRDWHVFTHVASF